MKFILKMSQLQENIRKIVQIKCKIQLTIDVLED